MAETKDITSLLPNLAKARAIINNKNFKKTAEESGGIPPSMLQETVDVAPTVSEPVFNDSTPINVTQDQIANSNLPTYIKESFLKTPPIKEQQSTGITGGLTEEQIKMVNPNYGVQTTAKPPVNPVVNYNNPSAIPSFPQNNGTSSISETTIRKIIREELEMFLSSLKNTQQGRSINENIQLEEGGNFQFLSGGYLYEGYITGKKKARIRKRD